MSQNDLVEILVFEWCRENSNKVEKRRFKTEVILSLLQSKSRLSDGDVRLVSSMTSHRLKTKFKQLLMNEGIFIWSQELGLGMAWFHK